MVFRMDISNFCKSIFGIIVFCISDKSSFEAIFPIIISIVFDFVVRLSFFLESAVIAAKIRSPLSVFSSFCGGVGRTGWDGENVFSVVFEMGDRGGPPHWVS